MEKRQIMKNLLLTFGFIGAILSGGCGDKDDTGPAGTEDGFCEDADEVPCYVDYDNDGVAGSATKVCFEDACPGKGYTDELESLSTGESDTFTPVLDCDDTDPTVQSGC